MGAHGGNGSNGENSATARYLVEACDIAGPFASRCADTFAECIELVREFAGRYPDKVIQVHSPDRCDYDHDGLTDDEREAVTDALVVRCLTCRDTHVIARPLGDDPGDCMDVPCPSCAGPWDEEESWA